MICWRHCVSARADAKQHCVSACARARCSIVQHRASTCSSSEGDTKRKRASITLWAGVREWTGKHSRDRKELGVGDTQQAQNRRGEHRQDRGRTRKSETRGNTCHALIRQPLLARLVSTAHIRLGVAPLRPPVFADDLGRERKRVRAAPTNTSFYLSVSFPLLLSVAFPSRP